jgi:hypothetical protein
MEKNGDGKYDIHDKTTGMVVYTGDKENPTAKKMKSMRHHEKEIKDTPESQNNPKSNKKSWLF